MKKEINIIQYKWAGKWGPFKIKIDCGECGITEAIIKNVLEKKFPKEKINFQILPWLDNWYKIIWRGGWHAPIVVLDGKVISQGKLLDPSLLEFKIREILTKNFSIEEKKGNHIIFSKKGCPFCESAKKILKENNIDFIEKDIVEEKDSGSQFFTIMKKIYPKNKPITVPQIFLDGKYFGTSKEIKQANENGSLKKYQNK